MSFDCYPKYTPLDLSLLNPEQPLFFNNLTTKNPISSALRAPYLIILVTTLPTNATLTR
jgi:hypothetical protein